MAVDSTNPNVVYLGGAEGGVWKTTDGGQTWNPLTDDLASLAVGSIAIDPQNSQTIYVGTGEADFGFDNYGGAGILKSTDGGSTWTRIAGPFVGPFASTSPYCGGAYIGSIAVDPANSQIVLAGAQFDCSAGSALYRSTDGGTSWMPVLGTSQSPVVVTGLVFDPTNGNSMYAAVGAAGSTTQDGIWKSTNAGLTWTQDNGSGSTAFPGSSAARISLTIAPSSPSTLYAGAASLSSGGTSVLGVYKTSNGGASWTKLTAAPPYCSPPNGPAQCYFDNVVAIAPNNPNIVLLGGSEDLTSSGDVGVLYLSVDGGATWTDITDDGNGNGIHPDMHAIAFSSDGSRMYVGNDGGVWSTSVGTTGIGNWTDLNQTLALTQFYPGLSIASTNSNLTLAGTQDNGAQSYDGNPTWNLVGCGDGAQTAIDPTDSQIAYLGCAYSPGLSNYGFLWKFIPNSGWIPAENGINGSDRGAFIPPLAMDPSNPNTLYFGTYRVYQTTDGGNDWTPISDDLTLGGTSMMDSISAITVAPGTSNTVYVGTYDGRLWVTSNATSGATWTSVENGIPDRSVTDIEVDPTNSQTAFATFSGYSGFNGDTLGHVFKTTNGGTSWTDISGNLPNVPVNAIVLDPDIPGALYVGTDIGVFETTDGGTSWAPLGTGLPNVAILSLRLHHATRILRAASYGRSAWDLQLPLPLGPTAVLSTATLDFAPQQVGTTSSAQVVMLTNNSSTDLSINNIDASTNYSETNTCGSSLAAGTNCTISVTLTPATFGSLTGTITLTDNAASGSTQTISLHGSGFSGTASLSPGSLSFGNQLVGTTSAAQTITLANSSAAPLTILSISAGSDFKATSSDCPISPSTLAGGVSCHISVSFAPTSRGTFAEQVTINDSASNSPQTEPITGTGIAPVVSLSTTNIQFTQEVGATSTQTATLTNTGTAALTITQVTWKPAANYSPDPLSESDTCPRSPSTLPSQGTCTISVTFAPATWLNSTGQSSTEGTVELSDNAFPEGAINVTATDYSGQASLSPTSLSFPDEPPGQSSPPQSITLTNSATTQLFITSINVGTPSIFTEKYDNCPRWPAALNAGASCTITAIFSPGQQQPPGTFTGYVNVSGSQRSPSQADLQGTVLGPTFHFMKGSLDFGMQEVGTASTAQTVNIDNTGNSNLIISSLMLGGSNASAFAILSSGTTCSTTLPVPAGSSCSISIKFSPSAPGNQAATLSVADNAIGSPQSIPLSGTGVDFGLATASGTASTAVVSSGSPANYSLTVTPEGGFNQAVRFTCAGAPSEASCGVSPNPATLDGTDPQNIKVLVTTTAGGLVTPGPRGGPPAPGQPVVEDWWVVLLLLVGMISAAFARRRRASLLAGAVLMAALALSCGGGGGTATPAPHPTGTPAGTYNLVVTGTSGKLTHEIKLTLTVQ